MDQDTLKEMGELSRRLGELEGVLRGILAWDIPDELREKIIGTLNDQFAPERHFPIDYTFPLRLGKFLDKPDDKEKAYLQAAAEHLQRYQRATATDKWELDYMKNNK